jgi:hypothetical protein
VKKQGGGELMGRQWYKPGDTVYARSNHRVGGVQIRFNETPLKVSQAYRTGNGYGYGYLVNFKDKRGEDIKWDVSQGDLMSPRAKKEADRQEKEIKQLLAQKEAERIE